MANSEVYNYDVFNRELILDLTLGAFYVYDISFNDDGSTPYVRDYLQIPPYYKTSTNINLYAGNNQVVDGSGNPITVSVTTNRTRTTDERFENFKFITTYSTSFTASEYSSYNFYDWETVDGVGLSYDSFLITGYNIAGTFSTYKQSIYLQVFCKRTEEYYSVVGATVSYYPQSSCKVQAQWDWSDSAYQGKWGEIFQAYRIFKPIETAPANGDAFDYGDTVITTKNKLRGRGRALSLYMYSEAGKDMKLLGWNVLTTINGEP